MNDVVGEAILLGARLFTGTVLVVAVVGKLRDFDSFVFSVRSFRIVPRRWERPLATTVVLAEIVAMVLLAVRDWATAGFGLAVLLLGAFTFAMVRVLVRSDRVMCGCFGSSTVPIGGMHILRNGVILMVGVSGIVASVTSDSRRLDVELLGVVSAFALFAAGFLVLADQVLAIPQSQTAPANRRAGATSSNATGMTKLTPANLPNTTPTER